MIKGQLSDPFWSGGNKNMSSKSMAEINILKEQAKRERQKKAAAHYASQTFKCSDDMKFNLQQIQPNEDTCLSSSVKNVLGDFKLFAPAIHSKELHLYLGLDNTIPGTPEVKDVELEIPLNGHVHNLLKKSAGKNGTNAHHLKKVVTEAVTKNKGLMLSQMKVSKNSAKPKPLHLSMAKNLKEVQTNNIEKILREMTQQVVPALTDIETPGKVINAFAFSVPLIHSEKEKKVLAAPETNHTDKAENNKTLVPLKNSEEKSLKVMSDPAKIITKISPSILTTPAAALPARAKVELKCRNISASSSSSSDGSSSDGSSSSDSEDEDESTASKLEDSSNQVTIGTTKSNSNPSKKLPKNNNNNYIIKNETAVNSSSKTSSLENIKQTAQLSCSQDLSRIVQDKQVLNQDDLHNAASENMNSINTKDVALNNIATTKGVNHKSFGDDQLSTLLPLDNTLVPLLSSTQNSTFDPSSMKLLIEKPISPFEPLFDDLDFTSTSSDNFLDMLLQNESTFPSTLNSTTTITATVAATTVTTSTTKAENNKNLISASVKSFSSNLEQEDLDPSLILNKKTKGIGSLYQKDRKNSNGAYHVVSHNKQAKTTYDERANKSANKINETKDKSKSKTTRTTDSVSSLSLPKTTSKNHNAKVKTKAELKIDMCPILPASNVVSRVRQNKVEHNKKDVNLTNEEAKQKLLNGIEYFKEARLSPMRSDEHSSNFTDSISTKVSHKKSNSTASPIKNCVGSPLKANHNNLSKHTGSAVPSTKTHSSTLINEPSINETRVDKNHLLNTREQVSSIPKDKANPVSALDDVQAELESNVVFDSDVLNGLKCPSLKNVISPMVSPIRPATSEDYNTSLKPIIAINKAKHDMPKNSVLSNDMTLSSFPAQINDTNLHNSSEINMDICSPSDSEAGSHLTKIQYVENKIKVEDDVIKLEDGKIKVEDGKIKVKDGKIKVEDDVIKIEEEDCLSDMEICTPVDEEPIIFNDFTMIVPSSSTNKDSNNHAIIDYNLNGTLNTAIPAVVDCVEKMEKIKSLDTQKDIMLETKNHPFLKEKNKYPNFNSLPISHEKPSKLTVKIPLKSIKLKDTTLKNYKNRTSIKNDIYPKNSTFKLSSTVPISNNLASREEDIDVDVEKYESPKKKSKKTTISDDLNIVKTTSAELKLNLAVNGFKETSTHQVKTEESKNITKPDLKIPDIEKLLVRIKLSRLKRSPVKNGIFKEKTIKKEIKKEPTNVKIGDKSSTHDLQTPDKTFCKDDAYESNSDMQTDNSVEKLKKKRGRPPKIDSVKVKKKIDGTFVKKNNDEESIKKTKVVEKPCEPSSDFCCECGHVTKDPGRDPLRMSSYKKSYGMYLDEGKRRKRAADCLEDPMQRAHTYIDAVLNYVQYLAGLELSGKLGTKRGAKEHMQICTKCIQLIDLRLESILYLKLFKLNKESAVKYSKILSEYHKQYKPDTQTSGPSPHQNNSLQNRGNNGTPSPNSPSPGPSPGGSVASIGSAGSSHSTGSNTTTTTTTTTTAATLSIPTDMNEKAFQYLQYTKYLLLGHRLWDDAERLTLHTQCESFIISLSKTIGQLIMQSSLIHVVDYISAGLKLIKGSSIT